MGRHVLSLQYRQSTETVRSYYRHTGMRPRHPEPLLVLPPAARPHGVIPHGKAIHLTSAKGRVRESSLVVMFMPCVQCVPRAPCHSAPIEKRSHLGTCFF